MMIVSPPPHLLGTDTAVEGEDQLVDSPGVVLRCLRSLDVGSHVVTVFVLLWHDPVLMILTLLGSRDCSLIFTRGYISTWPSETTLLTLIHNNNNSS